MTIRPLGFSSLRGFARHENLNRTKEHSYTQAASCEVSTGVEEAACSAATAAVTSGV
jgi:hypothetical protein